MHESNGGNELATRSHNKYFNSLIPDAICGDNILKTEKKTRYCSVIRKFW